MKTRNFRIIDIDHVTTIEYARSKKYLFEMIDDFIENLNEGYDLLGESFEILYEDGTFDYIDEEYDGHKIKKQHVVSIINHNCCTDVIPKGCNFEINEYGVVGCSVYENISEVNIEEIA